jgi:succinoglycan biosynthesis transport protein ExoP
MPNESRQQLQTIWAYRWWLGLFVVVAALAVDLVSKHQTPSYKATALIQVIPAAEASGQYLPSDAQQSLVNIYVRYAQTPAVYEITARKLGLGSNAGAVEGSLGVNPEAGSTVLDLTAGSADPKTAAKYADAYASALASFVQQYVSSQSRQTLTRIQSQIEQTSTAAASAGAGTVQAAQLNSEITALREKLASTVAAPSDSVQLLGHAPVPGAPTSPKPTRNAILAFLVSLILGGGVILGYAAISDRYRDADEISADLGLQLLGEMPRAPALDPITIEAFRRLRTSLLFELGSSRRANASKTRSRGGQTAAKPARVGATILVTAAERAAGKSYTTAGLSRALAADGWSVIAIDGDLRRPTLNQQLEVPLAPGLAELLSGEKDLEALSRPAPETGGPQPGTLDVLAAGRAGTDTTERLSSPEMTEMFKRAHEAYDYVVLDSSPILPVVDAVVLARYAQGVVLVVDVRSRRRDVRRAVQTLRSSDAPLLGFVYNRSKTNVQGYGYSQILEADRSTEAVELVP